MAPLIWDHLTCDETRARALSAALGVDPLVGRLLCQRGLDRDDLAARFLRPSLDHLHDPLALADMRPAVERLLGAIARRERIAVHGDYDVDGVTSTVILRRALELLGADVIHFIPERMKDGYGLQPAALDRFHDAGARVAVSVDCGIRGVEAADRARALGLDLIITDHHEPDLHLPRALAVINPKRHDCAYPDKNLAGVGVALKLVQALCARSGRERWLPAFVKVAAIGTLADVVPLVGENRVIAKLGLERLSTDRHTVGLRALLEVAGCTGKALDGFHIAFLVAPRVNAAGRMSTPDIATRLLLAADEAMAGEARELAAQLDAENLRRQQEEAEIVLQAKKAIAADPDIGAHNVLVVAGEGWHRGVIGIVASKLVESFHRPAIVVSIEDGVAHGSCRSIARFDMLGALERCADLFLRFGGHRQAAGFTMEAARVKELRQRVGGYADEILSPEDLMPRLPIDAALPLSSISSAVVQGVCSLSPFGAGNPKPVFCSAGEVVDGPRRLKDRHLSMTVRQEHRRFRAIAWRAAERAEFIEAHRAGLELAFSLEQGSYQGETYIELTVADVKPAAASPPVAGAAIP
jgi:single-stranded-DNA-specific exonuclease